MSGPSANPKAQLDPEVVAVIEETESWDLPADLVAASRIAAGLEVRFGGPLVDVAEVADATVAGEVPVRLYRPRERRGDGVVLWIHGGGWVCGTLDTCEPVARLIAATSGMTVVCVDYALSPEVAAPIALEQCLAAAEAVRRGACGEVSALAIGGDSAGANLAAGAALLSRDRRGPALDLQLLAEPVLHPRWRSASREAFATGTTITAEGIDAMWELYLQGVEPSPYTAPLVARDVSGLPPAIIVAPACDLLRDEARAYAARLIRAGNEVAYSEPAGLAHGIFTYFGVVAAARHTVERAARAVADSLLERPGGGALDSSAIQ